MYAGTPSFLYSPEPVFYSSTICESTKIISFLVQYRLISLYQVALLDVKGQVNISIVDCYELVWFFLQPLF